MVDKVKKYLIFIGLVIKTSFFHAQSLITTDPDNPMNTERPELTNHFDWRNRNFKVYHPDGHFNNGVNADSVSNPYYKREEYQKHFNLYPYEISLTPEEEKQVLNFHPADGWELLYKNTGIDPQGNLITDRTKNRVGPYIALYNKYTGLLRILAAFDGLNVSEAIEVSIKFRQISDLNVSALFNFYGRTSKPLDQKTDVVKIAQVSKFSVNRGFISADFQMSYDPCNCYKKSELETTFSLINRANIFLGGRLIGINTPIDASGNSPLLNREDFLLAVYKDGFDVKGGALIYSEIDKLIQKYKAPINDPFTKAAIDIFKSAISGVATVVDKEVLGPFGAIVFNEAFKDLPYYKEQEKVGLGLVAAGAKVLSAELFPEYKVPNISFSEAEMALSGTLIDSLPLNNGNCIFYEPGSLESASAQWQYYPLYNKPLGLFALLETPIVQRSTHVYNYSKGYPVFYRYKFRLNSFKYVFNPNADINLNDTKIYGALVIEGTPRVASDNSVRNLQQISYSTDNGKITHITPFVPIEYLPYIIPERVGYWVEVGSNTYGPEINVYLRIMIEYVFNQNRYGKVKKNLQIYTYPVIVEDNNEPNNSFQDLISFPINYTTSQDIMITQPTQMEYFAWNKIEIGHTVGSTHPTGQVNFKAKEIEAKAGAILEHGTTLTSGLPFPGQPKILPITNAELISYCSNQYKAYLPNTSSVPTLKSYANVDTSDSKTTLNKKDTLTKIDNSLYSVLKECEPEVYPNPNSGQFLISNIEPNSKIMITDINGIIIHSSLKNDNDKMIYLNIGNSIKPGVYVVKIITKSSIFSKRLVIN
ncbi:MAG: T9SS type A sorting domain-containing protein [Bacteroidales bacterium]